MKTVLLDKIASVTRACGLKREVRVSADIPCEEGVVVAVRVRNDKSTYSQLELPSGRMAQVKKGDVIAGALGHRHALFGYSGHLPERLAPGDIVSLLNMGGVIGICDSVNPDLGPPFECEVLGAVLEFPYLGERWGTGDGPRFKNEEVIGWSQTPHGDLHAALWATRLPSTADDCKNNGWQTSGAFKNQGDCVSYVAAHS